MQQMADTQIRRVPVVSHDDAHRLIGIVSLGDIATKAEDNPQKMEQVMEKVSFPSEPDLSSQTGTAAVAGAPGGGSNTGTATGMVGSDMLDDTKLPDVETSSTADPSDIVEVTPADLVNKNAPGSTALPSSSAKVGDGNGVVVRRTTGHADDTSTGESGAPAGIDAAGSAGASGGTAGTAGSSGTGVGGKA